MVGLEGARLAERRDAVIVLGVDSVTDDNNVIVDIESGRAMDDGPSNDSGIELMDLVEVQWTQRLHYRPLALALHAATSKKSKRALFIQSRGNTFPAPLRQTFTYSTDVQRSTFKVIPLNLPSSSNNHIQVLFFLVSPPIFVCSSSPFLGWCSPPSRHCRPVGMGVQLGSISVPRLPSS